MSQLPPIIVVAGPTGTGKTELSIELATHFGGEIINSDSMQVYRYLDIGTAKPTALQQAQVPHYVLDCVDPSTDYNAGLYAKAAHSAAERIHKKSKPVFLTGGTGLYIKSFLEGILSSPGRDKRFRAKLEKEHHAAILQGDANRLHERLKEIDAVAADAIHPNDLHRIIRSLELHYTTGERSSELRGEHGFKECRYRTLYLVVDRGRNDLNARINARCERMIERGLLQEVRNLRRRGFGPELSSMQAIGYRHMHSVVEGLNTLNNVQIAMAQDTRRFARRQRTWFRGISEAKWVHPDHREEIVQLVDGFLNT